MIYANPTNEWRVSKLVHLILKAKFDFAHSIEETFTWTLVLKGAQMKFRKVDAFHGSWIKLSNQILFTTDYYTCGAHIFELENIPAYHSLAEQFNC